MIRLGQALAQMHSTDSLGYPQRFNVKYVAFSEAKKEGGRIVDLKDVAINSMTNKARKIGKGRSTKTALSERNPQHDFHQTLNFQMTTGEIRKAHRCLLLEMNAERIII